MADNIYQKRTYELAEYNQLLPGEPGYEDPAALFIPIDKNGWAEARKISLVEFIYALHKEQGPYNLVGVLVDVEFDTAMLTTGYYLDIKATRIKSFPGIEDQVVKIPYKNLVKNLDGFTLELEDYIAGDYFNFLAFE